MTVATWKYWVSEYKLPYIEKLSQQSRPLRGSSRKEGVNLPFGRGYLNNLLREMPFCWRTSVRISPFLIRSKFSIRLKTVIWNIPFNFRPSHTVLFWTLLKLKLRRRSPKDATEEVFDFTNAGQDDLEKKNGMKILCYLTKALGIGDLKYQWIHAVPTLVNEKKYYLRTDGKTTWILQIDYKKYSNSWCPILLLLNKTSAWRVKK